MKSNKIEDIPTPPFIIYRVFSDGILRSGVVERICLHSDCGSLLGTPVTKWDQTHPIKDPIERNSTQYLVAINFTPKEAWEAVKYEANRSKGVKERNIDKLLEELKYKLKTYNSEIDKDNLKLKQAEEELKKY